MTATKYILGDVINGDYDEEYEFYQEALSAYEDYVEKGIEANATVENCMTEEDTREFFYIKKVTEEIVLGGTYNTVQM